MAVIARDLSAASADPEHSVESLVARARAEDDGRVQTFWPRLFAAVSDIPARRWHTAIATMAALGVASLALFLWWNLRTQVSAPADATSLHLQHAHGEQQTHRLADDSLLHLNTDTAVTVRYSKTERLVHAEQYQARQASKCRPSPSARFTCTPDRLRLLPSERNSMCVWGPPRPW